MSLASPQGITRDPATRPASTRARIVAALEQVEGLTAYPTLPDQPTAGAAWPRRMSTAYNGPLATLATDTWEVLVTLPASIAASTVEAGDAFQDLVAFTLAAQAKAEIQLAEPAQITYHQQAMPGLRFRIITH